MSPNTITFKQRLQRVLYFFPFQLLWVQLKKNHIILLFWVILFGYITGNLAEKYGVPYLFLFPEYLGNVSFMSHLILGFSCGGFIMAFNISTYIINGFRFPFLATLSRPFLKFCYNNLIIPVSFVAFYIYEMYHFQHDVELVATKEVWINIAGFILGNGVFIAISLAYFFGTNKNIFKLFRFVENKAYGKDGEQLMGDVIHNQNRKDRFNYSREWRVDTYISSPVRISLARGSEHYDESMLRSVFAQNHVNASYFEVLMVITFLTIGYFGENPMFIIPASASVFLLFTMLLMLSSAIHSWFKGWSITIFIVIILAINYLTSIEALNYTNYAYGMNYEGSRPEYSTDALRTQQNDYSRIGKDKIHTLKTLNNWRDKMREMGVAKPKLILIATSGGGLRSALWTVKSLLHVDSIAKGRIMHQTQLITGSSGGMIGAAFVRENFIKNLKEKDSGFSGENLTKHVSKDLLNPVTFTMVLHDLTLHFKTVEVDGYQYSYDRGYAFEKQLIENTAEFLDKRMVDYKDMESSSTIPTMIFAPTIINDGRKLLISTQPVSYLTTFETGDEQNKNSFPESVDFMNLFKGQKAENVRFTSVLRMNATFPYIMPMVSLPSEPEIKVMDAGIRDNYGLSTAMKYIYTFRDWIEENTSGIVILEIRAFKKHKDTDNHPKTVLQNFSSPLGNFYTNWTNVQTYDQDQMLQYANSWCKSPIDVVTLQLENKKNEARISLSWHLTQIEKKLIENAINSEDNQQALKKLESLLKPATKDYRADLDQ